MKHLATRFPAIDAFKAIAAQLIVLHHLAAYGPVSDAVQLAAPTLISWLYDNARMAVQVFLVIGGYLAARSLARQEDRSGWLTPLFNRYARLTIPFMAALALSIACAMVARHWVTDTFVPDAPAWGQLLAHALLLQSILDVDALTAGAWYVAIDFQLFVLMTGLVWLGRKTPSPSTFVKSLTLLLAVASLFWFNRNPELDAWAVYFFGAYGMGALAYWAGQRHSSWLLFMVLLAAVALMIDFRPRIAVAIAVAVALYVVQSSQQTNRWLSWPGFQALGKTSYSLFLVHFPILLLGNALFTALGMAGAWAGAVSMLTIWSASMVTAGIFYRRIENPASSIRVQDLHHTWDAGWLQRMRYRIAATGFLVLAIPV